MICKCGAIFEKYSKKAYMCRDCKREYDRNYHNNRSPKAKAEKLAAQQRRYVENCRKLYKFYQENCCASCGEADPVVLELDHIDPTNKRCSIAEMLTCSWKTIEAEIGKCRVLCANCHRRHTALQFNWYKFLDK